MNQHRPRAAIPALLAALSFAAAWGDTAAASELPGSPRTSGAEAGFAVDVDAARAVFGAPGESIGAGAAYVSECASLPCASAVRVVPGGLESRDLYGSSVALSGETLAVGAPGEREGSVYIFVRSGGVWLQQAKLRAFDGRNGDEFGNALALEGDRIVIGASGADDDRGVVYVFVRTGTAWALETRIQPTGQLELERFGHSVVLSGDTLAAGAPWRIGGIAGAWAHGEVRVYVRGASWIEQARLESGSATNGAQFGFSLDVGTDRLLVGAPGADGFRGNAFVFERAGVAWSQVAQLASPASDVGHGFGWSVALDGTSALVAAPYSALADAACGRIDAFALNGGTWVQQRALPNLLALPRETSGYAIAKRGGRTLIGSPGRDRGGVLLTGGANWYDALLEMFGDGFESVDSACQTAVF